MTDCIPDPGKAKMNSRKRGYILTDAQREWFAKWYPITPAKYMAEKLGVYYNWISFYARAHGLKRKPGISLRERYFELCPEAREHHAEAHRRIVKRERFNVRMGLHQETGIVIGRMTDAQYNLRHRMKQRGYIIFSWRQQGDPLRYTVCYDRNTRRSAQVERNAAKHGITVCDIRSLTKRHGSGDSDASDRNNIRHWML